MPKAEYSSEEDIPDHRRAWRGDTRSAANGSINKGRARKPVAEAKTQTSHTVHESQSFLKQHKSQILVAAALAVAGIVVNKVLRNKSSPPSKADKPAHPKKLAARRKRSG